MGLFARDRESFAIEREAPSEDKARAFIALLHQAHERRALSEAYLVELQNSVVGNPFAKALAFRREQNWLQGPARGAPGVSYVPPPEMVEELMGELMAFAALAPQSVDPVVAAAVTSFGFVFIHPFMDGNGRLSRFLFHHVLCRSGKLEKGLLLPVSVAMKRNEGDYLATLQQHSRAARERWSVRWIDEGQYEFTSPPGRRMVRLIQRGIETPGALASGVYPGSGGGAMVGEEAAAFRFDPARLAFRATHAVMPNNSTLSPSNTPEGT